VILRVTPNVFCTCREGRTGKQAVPFSTCRVRLHADLIPMPCSATSRVPRMTRAGRRVGERNSALVKDADARPFCRLLSPGFAWNVALRQYLHMESPGSTAASGQRPAAWEETEGGRRVGFAYFVCTLYSCIHGRLACGPRIGGVFLSGNSSPGQGSLSGYPIGPWSSSRSHIVSDERLQEDATPREVEGRLVKTKKARRSCMEYEVLPFDLKDITLSAATKARISPAQGGSRWKFQKTNLFISASLASSLSPVPHRETAPQGRGAGIISRPPPCPAAAGSWEVFFGLSRPVRSSVGSGAKWMATAHAAGKHDTLSLLGSRT
jgi:hypothetical protein